MHGYAKRALALIAAASGLVLGSAAVAAADVSISGHSARSGGAGSGNVASVPVDVPVNFCGNQAVAFTVEQVVSGVHCSVDTSGAPEVGVAASTYKSGGFLSGNVLSLAAALPLNVCGNQVALAAVESYVHDVTCSIN